MRVSEFWTLSSRPTAADITGNADPLSTAFSASFLQPHNRPPR